MRERGGSAQVVCSVAGASLSAVDLMFHALLRHIDQQNWEEARETTLKLQECLQVVSGRESRSRGGWQYSANYVLDSVLFADLLRHLQERSDVMTEAIHLKLISIVDSGSSVRLVGVGQVECDVINNYLSQFNSSAQFESFLTLSLLKLRGMRLVLDDKLSSHLLQQVTCSGT